MWENDPIVLQLIEYMIGRGCTGTIEPSSIYLRGYISFSYKGVTQMVYGEDIYNALLAAYRVEWEQRAIMKRFERYLIDLHSKRSAQEHFNKREGL